MAPKPSNDGTTRRRTLKLLGSGLAVSGIGSGGVAAVDDETSTATVTVEDQSPHYDTVYVSEATLPDDGFVALHDASFFLEGPVLGVSAPLSEGSYRNLPIQFDEYPDETLTVAAIVHRDAPSDGVSTYPDDGDHPFVGEHGLVADSARITPE